MLFFIVLNILDAHSTWLVVKPYNYHREKNPVARYVFRKLGIGRGIIIFKVVLLTFFSGVIFFYVVPDWETVNVSMIIGDLLFTFVVTNNYRIYRKLRKEGRA